MSARVSLYSKYSSEIYNFLKAFNDNKEKKNVLEWTHVFENPVEMADIIGVFIDNQEKYKINMWVSLDQDFFINITNYNANKIIRYLFERYPY